MRAIFANVSPDSTTAVAPKINWISEVEALPKLRIAIASGVLVRGSTAVLDLLLVGELATTKVKALIKKIERAEGREINYTTLSYDEFYYRLSVRDRFITEILQNKHTVLVDNEQLLTK